MNTEVFDNDNHQEGNREGQEGSKKNKLKAMAKSFSWISAFKNMTATRCNPWDHRELDILEGFKFVCVIFIQISATSLYINPSARATPWSALDMKLTWFFTLVISSN